MKNTKQKTQIRRDGLWIMIVAAVILEAISCTMYFTSRAAIRQEAELRAKTELRKAELEIEMHTIEMETAAKTLAKLASNYLNSPDSIFNATHLVVSTLRSKTSMAVAYVPDYFTKYGTYFEACSSRISEDSTFTRQIGSADHDYTQMEWYQNGFVHDSCWWCEPYLDDSGSQTFVVSCSCPVRNRIGEVVAVVCCDMSISDLKNISDYLQVYPNSYYSIKSSTGMDIVPVPDTVPGRKYNIYQEEIDATGWHIEIIIPEDELFRDLNRIGRIVSLLMILGLIVLALIVIYSARTTRKMLAFAEKNQRMEGELEVAQTIQKAMLPKVFPPFFDRRDLNIYGIVDPAKEIGGDLYDFYVRHNKLFFCVGDVSGKGVPAALVMATTRSLFRSITAHEEEPDVIVRKMNRALCDQNEQNMFLTLFLGVLDCRTGELAYCNAGHNAPVYVPFGHESCAIDVVANLPMGIEPEFEFRAQKMQMAKNDLFFLYTDGLSEAENKRHEQYGEERMMKHLEKCRTLIADLSPRRVVEEMQTDVARFVDGAQQSDDLTMLAIRYQQDAIIMRNDIQQIPTLAEWVDSLGIPDELNMPVNLALEEAVSNVMLYAYPDVKNGQVLVEFVRSCIDINKPQEQIVFIISDGGTPFDPTQQPPADISLSLEDRAIGGLGIHLVLQLMDEVLYERVDEKNVLTLIKRI
ncbi:MAG: SpoIIE family protein phosphatase [Paludibacteraceae bacterium]|nr:SpoIIE family protein phosphatase [Paludibacteraceae bacterium]